MRIEQKLQDWDVSTKAKLMHAIQMVWQEVTHPSQFEGHLLQLRANMNQVIAHQGGNWYRENRCKSMIRY